MSESDSFINEVNEEVRRDRFNTALRRYGWIGALLVVLIVGGAAWNEWRKARIETSAQALGDQLIAALEQDDAVARRDALDAVPLEGPAAPAVALLASAERLAAEDPAGAAQLLKALAGRTDLSAVYSDLAALKLVMLGDDGVDPTTRAQLLDRLAQPGAPYALLAREMQVLDLVAAGDDDRAVEEALALMSEAGLTQGMRQRLAQLVVALGGSLEAG